MIYDWIIIGGGAAGLFAAASAPEKIRGLILDKSNSPGLKLLMTGSGQCNLTHSGDIKDFIEHYGDADTHGKRIRRVLYGFNNREVKNFFEQNGVPIFTRPDGKVFPKSLSAKDVRDLLVKKGGGNGFEIKNQVKVEGIKKDTDGFFTIKSSKGVFRSTRVLIACGGISYPTTGSDGSIYPLLKSMGYKVNRTKPALVPIFVEQYPFGKISGNSISDTKVSVWEGNKLLITKRDSVLFTHENFSGPGVLNVSRHAEPGRSLSLNYAPNLTSEEILTELIKVQPKNQKQVSTIIRDLFPDFSSGFSEIICIRAKLNPQKKFSQLSRKELKELSAAITKDIYLISGTAGYNNAMATAGGIDLEEVNLKTMESRRHPGLYFAGEVLDVDGDTGGYNLQFAFSSAHAAMHSENQ